MADTDVLDIEQSSAPILVTDQEGFLQYRGNNAAFTRLDRSYISAAASAFRNGRDIALIYPSPPTFVQLPVLLAAGFQARGNGPPALFVSNRSGIREQYFNLGIKDKYSPPDIEPDPLGEFTAPMVKTGDGKSVSYITNHQPRTWDGKPEQAAIVHTNFGQKLANSCELPLSGLVLDFTTGLLDDQATQDGYERLAEERDIPRIMIFDSPSHDYLEDLEQANAGLDDEDKTLFWGWSHTEVESAPDKLLSPVADVGLPATDGGGNADGPMVANPFSESVGPLRNISNGISREIIEIPHTPLEEAAREAWDRTNEAAQTVRNETRVSTFAHQSIANSYFIYAYLDTLLSSVEYHDSLMRMDDSASWGAGKTIASKINSLRKRRDSLDEELLGLGEQIADCCDAFERVTEALREHNPKADELATQIRDAVDSDQTMTVLAPTRKQESIIRSFITERTEMSGNVLSGSGIKFHNLYSPHTIPESDILLFPGVPTNSHYPALLAGAASEHRFLIYSWTTSRFQRRLSDVLNKAEWRAGGGPMHHLADELGLSRDQLNQYTNSTDPRSPQPYQYGHESSSDLNLSGNVSTSRSSARSGGGPRVGKSDSVSPTDISIDLSDLASDDDDFWMTEQEFDSGQQQETINAGRSAADAESNDRGEVAALDIEFSDGTSLFEQPGGLLWKVDGSGSNLSRTRVAAQALDPGDRVIVIKDDTRRDLFEHIVEKIHAESRGPFQEYLSMLDLWVTGLDTIMEKLNPSPEQREFLNIPEGETPSKETMSQWIGADLKEWAKSHDTDHDPTRTSNQIKQWLTKETLGPSSPVVIRALGDCYDVESLRSHSDQIFKGLEKVRTLHQQVGMNLSKILIGARESDADDWLLEECGLKIGDIQSATTVKTISAVSSDVQQVNTTQLGRLLRT